MLRELERDRTDVLLPFAATVDFHLCCSAVLQGVCPGRCFADAPRHPTGGFILSAEGAYLIGDPESVAFVDGLRELLLSPDGLRIPLHALHVLVSSPAWIERLAEIVRPRQLHAMPRYHYVCTRDTLTRDLPTVPGASVRRLDESILSDAEFTIPDHIRSWAHSNWGGEAGLLSTGFAFVATVGNEIVSWSLADCVADGQCEIGIRTAERWRRRGYAALTAVSAAGHALDSGPQTVGWHCDRDNVGSWKTAEKAGFRRERSYDMFRIGG